VGVGDTDDEACVDHDKKLRKLLDRCKQVGIRLNADKLKLRQPSVLFMGHIVSRDGLKADPAKVKAVLEMPHPEDVEGVRRLNGFVNYISKFMPHLSNAMEPLRQLIKSDVPWNWGRPQEEAYQEVKCLAADAPTLLYYDPGKELVIQCDASEKGLGASILQDGCPLAYASRSLSDTERRYAQIEKELLAVVYSLEKFHQYTFGRHVIVRSDHKPLESIVKKALANAPKRLQGMLMRMQRYNTTIIYCKGKEMYLADTLSRAFLDDEGDQEDFESISSVENLPITQARLDSLKLATANDETLQALKNIVLAGWPEHRADLPPSLTAYFPFRDEIAA
jgi:hypothetical protein